MKILMVLNKSYHEDMRAQREVSALAQAGHSVTVLCFRDSLFSAPHLPNVSILQCPIRRKRHGRIRYALEYMIYFAWCMLALALQVAKERFDVLQIFLHPEPLILAGVIPKLCGVRVLADWMDLGLELYETKYLCFRYAPIPILFRLSERLVTALADNIIFPNKAFPNTLSGRGVEIVRHEIVMNAADSELFRSDMAHEPRTKASRLLFTGNLSERSGVHSLLKAFAKVERAHPDWTLTILGEPIDRGAADLSKNANLFPKVQFTGRVAVSEVLAYMSATDIGIIPTKDTPFTRCNVPTRLLEFGAAGIPVVCSDLPGIRDYFDDRHVLFYKPDSPADLADRIIKLMGDHDLRRSLAQGLRKRSEELSWTSFRAAYLQVVATLGCDSAGNWGTPPASRLKAIGTGAETTAA